MKICPTGAEMFYADGRTNRHDEANISFLLFGELALKGRYPIVLL
jgi:hypothetical protein